ncbi:AAA family ATPase [Thermophilibacter sp.]
MILRSLTLSNFHRFERYSIDFDDRLTVLVGDNGSGKSSILRAASIALSAFLSCFNGTRSVSITPQDARLVTYEQGDVIDRQAQYPVEIIAIGVVEGDIITWKRGLNSPKGKTTRGDAKEMTSLGNAYYQRLQSGDPDLVLPLVAYYGTGRLWSKKQTKSYAVREIGRTEGYRDSLDTEINDKALLAWFKKMTVQELQYARRCGSSPVSATLSAVRQAIANCFSLVSGYANVAVDYNFDTNDLDVVYHTESGEAHSLPLGYFSDGYRTTLSMVADVAYRMALLNPGLGSEVIAGTPGVVLIDEVDLHLHPRWQARVLGDLQSIFPQVQFIVTTHAPLVISSVRAKHIRMLEAELSKATTPQAEVYGGNLNRLVTTVMGSEDRPKDVQRLFDAFYQSLDKENFARAKDLLNELVTLMGDSEPDVIAAQTAYALEAE